MNLRLILPATAAMLVAATSCTPYRELPPPAPRDPAMRQVRAAEPDKSQAQPEAIKRQDAEVKVPEPTRTSESEQEMSIKPRPDPQEREEKGSSDAVTLPPTEKKPVIPVARPIPGKVGMVFSPFNNKPIDVKGIPSGRLVADPTYPPSEKKHFRVP
ncbi:MAG: hypothetical protein EAZ65_09605 [Verrucomicrobia bacterium]|nr:MAG: hypothetical protein EAZ84_10880 [Verrucomicrobiota bacterium]TAE85265.1 MAG: hypothetical protein EAZ82_13520 [Verrucomicrobiota bacterium]TAF22691.1 MAG: hypothetical protein EAZ71_13720 [Verrucomicrobiota bacterium]TAF39916.1 MAG: hypothetical protein EAZ65_09605 [Verrucomicrobiota bacterium]